MFGGDYLVVTGGVPVDLHDCTRYTLENAPVWCVWLQVGSCDDREGWWSGRSDAIHC